MRIDARRSAILLLLSSFCYSAVAQPITPFEFLGEAVLPQGLDVDGFRVGGISGLAWEPERDFYYAVADDPNDARFFIVRIDFGDGRLGSGDVTLDGAVLLEDIDGRAFAPGSLDPEGIAIDATGDLYVASEAVRDRFPPFIRKFTTDGAHVGSLFVNPLRYDPRFSETRGAQPSGGFESLTVTADQRTLFAAVETALKQDAGGPERGHPTMVRILEYDLVAGAPVAEFAYPVGRQTLRPDPPEAASGIGLNDLLWIGGSRFLSLEREYAHGVTDGDASRPVKMYEVDTTGADNVIQRDALDGSENPVSKNLVLDFDSLLEAVKRIGSHEAMVLGPTLADGRRVLVLVEDNDFSRPTQVLAFAVSESMFMDR
jgi:hypothetical protein